MRISERISYGAHPAVAKVWAEHVTELTEIHEKAVEPGVFDGSTNLLVVGPTSSGKTLVGEMAAATWGYRMNRVLVAAGVVAGAALASGAGLPPAWHPIAGGGPGPGQVREVPEREVSEA